MQASLRSPRSVRPCAGSRSVVLLTGLALLTLTATGCPSPAPEAPPEPEPEPISNTDLDLTLSDTPAGFQLETNQGPELRFSTTDPAIPGELWYEVDEPSDYGIELGKEAQAQKELFEALPNGESFGGRQLMSHLGEAFYARGRFDDESGQRVEELRLFALHPRENRLVTIHYRYPAGEDSADRVRHSFEALGQIESAPASGETSEETSEGG